MDARGKLDLRPRRLVEATVTAAWAAVVVHASLVVLGLRTAGPVGAIPAADAALFFEIGVAAAAGLGVLRGGRAARLVALATMSAAASALAALVLASAAVNAVA